MQYADTKCIKRIYAAPAVKGLSGESLSALGTITYFFRLPDYPYLIPSNTG